MEDKRVHPRVIVDLTVSCEPKDGSAFTGLARDISVGGMFIETSAPMVFGSELSIVVRLPGAKADFRLPAIVRWVKSGGFGVQFGLLGARETHAITELLH
ncbi:MAG TPA: PilZ domain-containing protein [Polyangiaceae bacterium]